MWFQAHHLGCRWFGLGITFEHLKTIMQLRMAIIVQLLGHILAML